MAEHVKASAFSKKIAKVKGLSAGVGDGRSNDLREAGRASRAGKVRHSVMQKASPEDAALFGRIWSLIQHERYLTETQTRQARIQRARRLMERGELETDKNLDLAVDGLLGLRTSCEDPSLGQNHEID